MRTVILSGELGKEFGTRHEFDIRSPAEAIRALSANFPGFQKFMFESESRNVGFEIITAGHSIEDLKELSYPCSGDIRIVPRIMGSSAEARIIIGAAIIVAATVLTGGAATGSTAAIVGSTLTAAGASLVLGGVIQLISPPPTIDGPEEPPENTPSYLFNGPINSQAQGNPVPCCYGKLTVGGAVVSAGISTESIKGGFKRVRVNNIEVRENLDLDLGPPYGITYDTWYPNLPPTNFYQRDLLYSYLVGQTVTTTFTDTLGTTWTAGTVMPYKRVAWRYYWYSWNEVPA